MITTAIFPARYVQGEGALDSLGEDLCRLGGTALAIVDPFALKTLHERILAATQDHVGIAVEAFGGECSDEEIERLGAVARDLGADVIVGIGGGKTLDAAKAVAHAMSVPVAIVPTLASSDAPCSALSVIYTPDGVFKRYLVLPRNPELVLVDSAVIAAAPVRFLVAGMGDALATWFEAEDQRSKRGVAMTGRVGPMTAYALARLSYDTLRDYGGLAKAACEQGVVTPALERVVEATTLLSGLGFESGGLAAAHAVHNGLTALKETRSALHGERLAIGTLTMLMLTGRPAAVIDELYEVCETLGLPTTLAGIGLEEVPDERLWEAAVHACADGETIHNEPYEVTPRHVVAALKAADAEGRRRKGRA